MVDMVAKEAWKKGEPVYDSRTGEQFLTEPDWDKEGKYCITESEIENDRKNDRKKERLNELLDMISDDILELRREVNEM